MHVCVCVPMEQDAHTVCVRMCVCPWNNIPILCGCGLVCVCVCVSMEHDIHTGVYVHVSYGAKWYLHATEYTCSLELSSRSLQSYVCLNHCMSVTAHIICPCMNGYEQTSSCQMCTCK